MPIRNTSAEALGKSLNGDRVGSRSWAVPGPGHSPKDRSLHLTDTQDGVVFHSFAGDDNEAVIDYLLAASGGCRIARGEHRTVHDDGNEAQRIAKARSTWDAAGPITRGSPAELYLTRRGLPPPYRDALRFHPGVTFDGAKRPALVARVSHAYGGETTAVQITFLTLDGHKDVDTPVGEDARVIWGVAKGCGVWPESFDGLILVAEGVETALSAERQFGIPAVAALNTSGLKSIYLPHRISEVVIVADNDVNDAGMRAAEKAAFRFNALGRIARIIRPPHVGQDANDVLVERGDKAVPVTLARRSPPPSDAQVFGQGVMLIATAPFSHEYLDGAVETKSGKLVGRWRIYFDLCRQAQYADQVRSITLGTGERAVEFPVLVPRGCIIASRRYIAERYGISENAARNLLDQFAKFGLVSLRDPTLPDGTLIPRTDAPLLIEVPSMPVVAGVHSGHSVMGLNSDHEGDLPPPASAQGYGGSSAQGVSIENRAMAMGYEVVKMAPVPRGSGGPVPYSLEEGHEKGNSPPSLNTGKGAGRVRVPLIDTFDGWSVVTPLGVGRQPWYGVPPELRRRAANPSLPPPDRHTDTARARISYRKTGRPSGKGGRA